MKTKYIEIDARIHKDEFYGFKMTDKAVNVKIGFCHQEFGGDCVVYVWLPQWAFIRRGNRYNINVTENMNSFRVWNRECNKAIELTRDEFKKCVEMN